MALKVNSAFAPSLVNAADEPAWAAAFKSGLGANRKIICKRHPTADVSADIAFADGVTFRDVPVTGEMVIDVAGRITYYGNTGTPTVSTAADLLTGTSVMRIEGNGNYVQGTLGLSAQTQLDLGVPLADVKAYDFTLSEQPSADNSIAFASTFSIVKSSAPPAETDSLAPYMITHQDWSTGVAGAEQTIIFDENAGDIIWDDAEITADIGATPYRRSSKTIVHGTGGDAFEFGIHRFKLPNKCNDEADAPVFQVLIAMKPHGRWAEYPAMSTYNEAYDSTFPKPFKIIIKNYLGLVLHTIEMHDGLPVNDPSLCQTRTFTEAFRPFVHTKMMLHWTSARLKLSAKARKYHNGVDLTYSMRPKQAKAITMANGVIPVFSGERQQYNGHLHMLATPAWPLPADTVLTIDDPNLPTNLNNIDYGSGATGKRTTSSTGYMYEPGAVAGHDWYISPGGQRFDRYFVPSQLTCYVSNPTGVRTQGNVPWRTICDEYGKGHLNHGHHDVTNPRTLETLPFSQVAYYQWAYAYGYYTPQGPVFVAGGESRHIDTHTIRNGSTWDAPDKDGRRHYHGWNVDHQHAYVAPGWWMLMFNSVIHMVSQKLKLNAALMSYSEGWASPTAGAVGDGYLMKRQHAWRLLNFVQMWKMTTSHSVGVNRAELEARWLAELEHVHDTAVVPATNPAHADYNTVYNKCIRAFGVPGIVSTSGTDTYVSPTTDSKTLYLFGVLTLMRQVGAWDVMRAKSAKAAATLDFILNNLHTYSVKRMLATNGRGAGIQNGRLGPYTAQGTATIIPASWEEWASYLAPVNGQEDLITKADGTPWGVYDAERDENYQHLWVQAIVGFRDYWGDLNLPGVTEASNQVIAFENTVKARVEAGGLEWSYRHPAVGILAPPPV